MHEELKDERLKANIQLLEILRSLIYSYPNQRFNQILSNFDFVNQCAIPGIGAMEWADDYYLEPKVVLERVNTKIKTL